MNPYVTPETTPDGKKLLAWQLEGLGGLTLWDHLTSRMVRGYRMHDGHTFGAAWGLTLLFDGQLSVEFSSACTMTAGWQEMGSLNIALSYVPDHVTADASSENREIPLPALSACRIDKITYEEDGFITECGLAIVGADGTEIIITSAASPGSVTVSTPFLQDQFDPEFALALCRRERLAGKYTGTLHGK